MSGAEPADAPAAERLGLWGRLREAGEGRLLPAVVSWLCCIVLGWFVAGVLVAPVAASTIYPRWQALVGAAVLVVGVIVAVGLSGGLVRWLEQHPWVRRGLGLLWLTALGATMVRVGLAIWAPTGWDSAMVEEWSYGMVHGGADSETLSWMINLYPNNSLLVAALTRWYELCAAVGITGRATGAVLITAMAMTAAFAIGYLTTRRVAGPTAGYVYAVLLTPFLAVSPYAAVAYSDTIGMLFPITIIYLFVRLLDADRLWVRGLLWLGIGVVFHLGYQVKPTVLFALLAVIGGGIAVTNWRRWTRPDLVRRATAAVALAAGVGVSVVGSNLLISPFGFAPEGEEVEHAMPFTHFLNMGAVRVETPYGTHRWGGYNHPDVVEMINLPPEERSEHAVDSYLQRVEAMGPYGYAEFLNDKGNWVFGDGSFFAYGEGTMSAPDPGWVRNDARSTAIRDWVNLHGAHYPTVLLGWQVLWLAVLVLLVAPVVAWPRGMFNLPSAAMRLSLVGLLVFLLLFEARPRYLYLYLPVFVALSSLTAVRVAGTLRRRSAPEQSAPVEG